MPPASKSLSPLSRGDASAGRKEDIAATEKLWVRSSASPIVGLQEQRKGQRHFSLYLFRFSLKKISTQVWRAALKELKILHQLNYLS